MNLINIETVHGIASVFYKNRHYSMRRTGLAGILWSLFWQRAVRWLRETSPFLGRAEGPPSRRGM